MFGASSSAFATPSTAPAFGASSPFARPAFGTPSSTPAFGTPSSTPSFGASSSAFGTPSSTPAFGTPSSTPGFGTPTTPAFGTGFGSSLFSTPFSQTQQQTTSLFPQPNTGGFGISTPFGTPQQQTTPFPGVQLTTQMAPVAPLPFSLAERDIQAIVDAYKDDPGNPKYVFKHLLFSVTEPQFRVKPTGISDIMWAEAMGKLEGLDTSNRERLWPQLVKGFKDLSQRLKIQDEVIVSDLERLRTTQSNVKMLQRHFQAETLPWIERLRQKEHGLESRLLRIMRILEALEGKGCRLPLMKGEVELAEKLAALIRQLKGSGADLSRRVQNLMTISRVRSSANGTVPFYLPGSTKMHGQSLADMQELSFLDPSLMKRHFGTEVLQQQTDAIARLGNVLKRDIRDMEIIMAEDNEMVVDIS